ncbi:faeA-like family protein, partial [Escherichia coli]|nr:faeA-like family protein [Escherichia coli]
ADAIGLTIYQIRAHLTLLQDAGIVERVNIGRGRPGVWILK